MDGTYELLFHDLAEAPVHGQRHLLVTLRGRLRRIGARGGVEQRELRHARGRLAQDLE